MDPNRFHGISAASGKGRGWRAGAASASSRPGDGYDEEEKKEEDVDEVIVIDSDSEEDTPGGNQGGNANRLVANNFAACPVAQLGQVRITSGMLGIVNLLGGDANTLTCEGSAASSRHKLHALADGGLSRNCHQPLHIYKRDNWSCCYQALIMMLSALWPGEFWRDVPSMSMILDVQETMQNKLWSKGYALEDREVYGGRLVDTTSRIGASVVWYYLTYKLIDAVMVEFVTDTSRALFGDFVWAYFNGNCSEHRCEGKLLTSERKAVKHAKRLLKKVSTKGYESDGATMRSCGCSMMPLFLLWPGHGQEPERGHAVLVVGIKKTGNSFNLLVFDPDQDLQSYSSTLMGRLDGAEMGEESVTSEIERTIDELLPIQGCQIILSTGRQIGEGTRQDRLAACCACGDISKDIAWVDLTSV